MTRMWQEMKEIRGKSKFNSNRIPKSIKISHTEEYGIQRPHF